MKRFLLYFVLVGSMVILTGCNMNLNRTNDPFYTSTGEWDSIRFPLLKPYEVVNGFNGGGWSISLPFEFDSQVHDMSLVQVQSIAVENGVIMVTTANSTWLPSSWYVLIPSKHIRNRFDNSDDLYKFVVGYGVNELNWATPDALNDRFIKTGCLDWIPGCK